MGMGLAIVRSIIDNHRDRISATQNPDRGVTLEFTLPLNPVRLDETSRRNQALTRNARVISLCFRGVIFKPPG
jgi:hypothetical protein